MSCQSGISYKERCRCDYCVKRNTLNQKRYRLRVVQRARGAILPEDQVDPTTARELIIQHYERGISIREISRITGVDKDRISRIKSGAVKTIVRRNSDKIIRALSEEDDISRAIDDTTLVHSGWAGAMVRGLSAQGWTFAHQEDILYNNLGIKAGFIKSIASERRTKCIAKNEAHVRWLVRAIGNKTGPSTKAMTIMRNKGYFPIKHYNVKGDLIVSTLSEEQRQFIRSV